MPMLHSTGAHPAGEPRILQLYVDGDYVKRKGAHSNLTGIKHAQYCTAYRGIECCLTHCGVMSQNEKAKKMKMESQPLLTLCNHAQTYNTDLKISPEGAACGQSTQVGTDWWPWKSLKKRCALNYRYSTKNLSWVQFNCLAAPKYDAHKARGLLRGCLTTMWPMLAYATPPGLSGSWAD